MVAFVSVILEEEEEAEEEERSKESFRLPLFAFSFEIENFPVPPANFHPRASIPLSSLSRFLLHRTESETASLN